MHVSGFEPTVAHMSILRSLGTFPLVLSISNAKATHDSCSEIAHRALRLLIERIMQRKLYIKQQNYAVASKILIGRDSSPTSGLWAENLALTRP